MDLKEYTLTQLSNDVSALKKSDAEQNEKIKQLELNDKLQDRDINFLQNSLNEINENTKWLRRMFTKTLVTGIIGVFFTVIGGLILWYFTTK
ncbi:hypothetical protein [Pullulanibacillus camelliae]|nr:hypothetical protein [Pullulanibacillus camelliae]